MVLRHAIAALLFLSLLAGAETVNPRIVERYKQMLAANPAEGIALDRLWKIATDEGTADKLIAEYEKAGDAAGKLVLGHLLRKAGRDDDAAAAFKRAAALDAMSPLPFLALARIETNRTQPRAAAEHLEKAVALLKPADPRMADTLLQLGAAWLAAGEPAKAAGAWEHTVRLSPDDTALRSRLAGTYIENLMPEAALKHLEHLAGHSPPAERAAALQQIARLKGGLGKPDGAMRALEQALAITAPGNWLRQELLGEMIRLAQRQHGEAELEAKWKAQVEREPHDPGGAMQLVEFYERTGNLDQQRVWLEKLAIQLPKNTEVRLKLARLLAQLDDTDRAAAMFDELIAAQPANVSLVFERARLDMLRDDTAAARNRIATILAKSPDDETLRQKGLDFYREHRMLELIESHMKADALSGTEEAVIALADFYFSQRRSVDGLATLKSLIRPGDPPARRAAQHVRAAQVLKGHGEITAAISAVREAIALQPDVREEWLLLGDLELARSRHPQARDAFLKMYAHSKDEPGQLEADARLFETFRAENAGTGRDARPRSAMAAQVEGFIRGLMDNARERGDAAGWLRVARWKAWNNDKSSAVTFAVKATGIEPKNPAPLEFLARHLAAHGDVASALEHLRTLLQLKGAGHDETLREIARLELLRGNTREAVDILTRLERANPGSHDVLANLAATLERAGRLDDAAAHWRKALALAPAPRKREAASALLRVLQRLGRHEEAAVLLLRAVEETRDEKERFARFDELLLHAREHGQLDWLRTRLAERRALRADDYFTTVALGRVMKLLGDKAAAFELFADAVFLAPNQAGALPELVREAETLHRMDAAVRLQEQLVRVSADNRPDAMLKLAKLYRDTGGHDGWERTWTRAVAKFPRDVEVLRGAAEFHREWGDTARGTTLLRKLLVLEPANLRAASELGELEFLAGNMDGARMAFEVVMRLTRQVKQQIYPAENEGAPWEAQGPQGRGMAGLAARTAGQRPAEWKIQPVPKAARAGTDDEMRLAAVRRLAMIAVKSGGEKLARWIADWKPSLSTQPVEALWALYFAGARDDVLENIGNAIRAEPQNAAHRQAFLWLALESGQFARVGAWLAAEGRTADEYADFSAAFAEFVKAQPGAVGNAMIEGLFPRGRETRLWPSAVELARNRRFDVAIELGMRAFEKLPSRRAAVGSEIARWNLAAGNPAGARALLHRVIEGGGDSFESPVYGAIRELHSLLPEDERAAFIAARLKAADPETLSGMISRITLFILAGRDDDAAMALDRVFSTRPMALPGYDDGSKLQHNAAGRELLFSLGASVRLMEWNQPALALKVLDHALADDGRIQLQAGAKAREQVAFVDGGSNVMWVPDNGFAELVKTARNHRDMLRYLNGGPAERGAVLLGRRGRDADQAGDFTETLEWFRSPAAQLEVLLAAWNRDRANASLIRRVLAAADAAGDEEQAELIRRVCLDGKPVRNTDNSPREFALELADILAGRGAVDAALETIRKALAGDPADFRLLEKRMQLLERTGRNAEAGAVLDHLASLPTGDPASRNALALKLELRDDIARASAVRLRGGGGGDPQLPLVLYKLGRTDEALAAQERLSGPFATYAAMTLAEAMGLRGDAKNARGVLIATASRVSDPRSQMQLRSKLLTIPGAPPSALGIARMQERLRQIAETQPELADGYFEFFDRHAERFGIRQAWEQEVARSWAAGSGMAAAGLIALRHRLAVDDAAGAAAICTQLAARVDAAGKPDALGRMDAELARSRHPALRLDVAAARAKRGWPYAEATFDWVRLLDGQGQRERARQVLDEHSWLTGTTGGAAHLGHAWLSLGDAEKARSFFRVALKSESPRPGPATLAGMARVHLATNNPTAARLLLRRAFSNPGCREQAALVDYIQAANATARWREIAAESGLRPAAEFRLGAAMFAHFEKQGRLAEALALVLAHPNLVTPAGSGGVEPFPAITCARIRAFARKTGQFSEAARTLETLAATDIPEAKADFAALHADRAVSEGEPVILHLAAAADAEPSRWEFAQRLAAAHMAAGENKEARKVIERFLASSVNTTAREQAFEMWEKAATVR